MREGWDRSLGRNGVWRPMNDRERFIACVLGEPVDRPPFWLFWGPWRITWECRERKGKPAHAIDHRSIFQPDHPLQVVPVNVNCGPCPTIDQTALVEEEESVIHDGRGVIRLS